MHRRTALRSALAGGIATLGDLAVIAVAVGVFGVSPRVANVPALLLGATVQFFGNRHFAFEATAGSVERQAVLFALTEVVALTLNGLGYDLLARHVALDTVGALVARLGLGFFVFVLWSQPIWRRVFVSDRCDLQNKRAGPP